MKNLKFYINDKDNKENKSVLELKKLLAYLHVVVHEDEKGASYINTRDTFPASIPLAFSLSRSCDLSLNFRYMNDDYLLVANITDNTGLEILFDPGNISLLHRRIRTLQEMWYEIMTKIEEEPAPKLDTSVYSRFLSSTPRTRDVVEARNKFITYSEALAKNPFFPTIEVEQFIEKENEEILCNQVFSEPIKAALEPHADYFESLRDSDVKREPTLVKKCLKYMDNLLKQSLNEKYKPMNNAAPV